MLWKLVLYSDRHEADKGFFEVEIPYIQRTHTQLHHLRGKQNLDDKKNAYELNDYQLRLYPEEVVENMSAAGLGFTVLEPGKVWQYADDIGRTRFMDLEAKLEIWASKRIP